MICKTCDTDIKTVQDLFNVEIWYINPDKPKFQFTLCEKCFNNFTTIHNATEIAKKVKSDYNHRT